MLLGVVLGACSGSGPRTRDTRRFDPAKAAARLRAARAVDIEGDVRYGDVSGPLRGSVGYRPDGFHVRTAVGAAAARRWVTFVGVGTRAWVGRAVGGATTGATLSDALRLVLLRRASAPPYLELPHTRDPSAWSVTAMFDPARVLDAVAGAKVDFAPARSATIDGEKRRGLRAELAPRPGRPVGLLDVTVWIDDTGLPRRLAATTALHGATTYDIRTRHEPVLAAAPDPAAIDDPAEPLPDATGPYSAVTTTRAVGIAVTVLAAPAAQGWTCWKVVSDPPYLGIDEIRPSGGTCTPPIDGGDAPEDQFAIPLTSAPHSPYALLALLVPRGSRVEFRRFGAEPVTVTPGPRGLALYTGRADTVVGLAVVTTPEAKLVCGPAGIDNEADFVARDGGQTTNGDIVGVPWNCLGADDARDLG